MDKDSIKTAPGHRFHATGDQQNDRSLFTVNPDIPVLDALNSVSCLLSNLGESLLDAAVGNQPLQDHAAWLTHHTLESAKAVVDSLIDCMEARQWQPPAPVSKWRRQGGFVNFYILDEVHIQRAPFGKYGPFPTANAMREALDRLEDKFPDLIMISRKASLAADLIGESQLNEEHTRTLERLAELGV